MSLKKRGKFYYWHEWIDGVEYRESLKTTDRNEAKRRRQDRVTEIKNGQAGKLSRQHFEAAKLEFLKGLRALLDARIAQASRARAKGEKIEVE